jgi:hypothetical protein
MVIELHKMRLFIYIPWTCITIIDTIIHHILYIHTNNAYISDTHLSARPGLNVEVLEITPDSDRGGHTITITFKVCHVFLSHPLTILLSHDYYYFQGTKLPVSHYNTVFLCYYLIIYMLLLSFYLIILLYYCPFHPLFSILYSL